MLAVRFHRHPKPDLGKTSVLVPIVDWSAGRVQLKVALRWNRRARYITLVRIPDDHPVRLCFSYGDSNFIKGLVWPLEPQLLRDYSREHVKAIAEWWDARSWSANGEVEPGGLMADEPNLFLGRRLPDSCVLWTKDVRLLYGRRPARLSTRARASSGGEE